MRACIRGSAAQLSGARVELESGGHSLFLDLGTDGGLRVRGLDRLEDRTSAAVGPFSVTPFLVDPSVRDASAILVAADGTSALYVGDLRAGILDKLLLAPPLHVDVLLMEGATIGSGTNTDGFPTETDFEDRFTLLFRETAGMPLVWCAPQNVERIVTIYRACLRTGRQFIVDRATADMLRPVAHASVPPEVRAGIKVLIGAGERRHMKRGADAPEPVGPPRIGADELAAAAPQSVMLFRPSLMQDLEHARCLSGARLIFSMWSGYLEYENANPVLEWLDRNGVPLDQCHTSGRAAIVELIELRRTFSAAPVVPIGRHPERFVVLFGKVQRRPVGEWWEIAAT